MRSRSVLFVIVFTCAGVGSGALSAAAQESAGLAQGDQRPLAVDPKDEKRACDGCPPRRIGTSLLQATVINVFYEVANLARGQVTARITPKTWWENMQQGWVWDLDDFTVNQIGHPYQGNNYFNAGRANGLNFYESAALTAFGSATWEFFGETNHASLNDFINTTLGGIALGEMFHRVGWMAQPAGDWQAAPLERNRRDRARSHHRSQPLPERRLVAYRREAV